MNSDIRQRRRALTREALERVAIGLFTERGYDAVSVAEITAAAHFSARTFFRYFSTKDEVVFAPFADDLAVLREIVRRRATSDLDDAYAALLEFADHLETEREWLLERCRLVMSSRNLELRRLELQRVLADMLARDLARAEGLPRPDLRHQLVGGGMVNVLAESMAWWFREGGLRSIPSVIREAVTVVRCAPMLV